MVTRRFRLTVAQSEEPKDKDVLWIDTSNQNEIVQKLYENGEWKPFSSSGTVINTANTIDIIKLF